MELRSQCSVFALPVSVRSVEGRAEHLKEARQQLHQVLDEVYASDYRDRNAA